MTNPSFSGRFGDIWQHSDNNWWAIEFTSRGTERLHRDIPESNLPKWYKRLRVPKDEWAQANFAKSFPGTVEKIQARFSVSKKTPKSENSDV